MKKYKLFTILSLIFIFIFSLSSCKDNKSNTTNEKTTNIDEKDISYLMNNLNKLKALGEKSVNVINNYNITDNIIDFILKDKSIEIESKINKDNINIENNTIMGFVNGVFNLDSRTIEKNNLNAYERILNNILINEKNKETYKISENNISRTEELTFDTLSIREQEILFLAYNRLIIYKILNDYLINNIDSNFISDAKKLLSDYFLPYTIITKISDDNTRPNYRGYSINFDKIKDDLCHDNLNIVDLINNMYKDTDINYNVMKEEFINLYNGKSTKYEGLNSISSLFLKTILRFFNYNSTDNFFNDIENKELNLSFLESYLNNLEFSTIRYDNYFSIKLKYNQYFINLNIDYSDLDNIVIKAFTNYGNFILNIKSELNNIIISGGLYEPKTDMTTDVFRLQISLDEINDKIQMNLIIQTICILDIDINIGESIKIDANYKEYKSNKFIDKYKIGINIKEDINIKCEELNNDLKSNIDLICTFTNDTNKYTLNEEISNFKSSFNKQFINKDSTLIITDDSLTIDGSYNQESFVKINNEAKKMDTVIIFKDELNKDMISKYYYSNELDDIYKIDLNKDSILKQVSTIYIDDNTKLEFEIIGNSYNASFFVSGIKETIPYSKEELDILFYNIDNATPVYYYVK